MIQCCMFVNNTKAIFDFYCSWLKLSHEERDEIFQILSQIYKITLISHTCTSHLFITNKLPLIISNSSRSCYTVLQSLWFSIEGHLECQLSAYCQSSKMTKILSGYYPAIPQPQKCMIPRVMAFHIYPQYMIRCWSSSRKVPQRQSKQ